MIVVPDAETPLVSVLVVTYGQWGWVQRCLRALVANTEIAYELIVVDNDSPDCTADRLHTHLSGATVVDAGQNLGFAVGNNLAALSARAPYLMLLNSDCLVEPGWLPPLLERAQGDPHIGAVAGCLLDLDGTVQEAGSVLGGDAETIAYGRGGALADPEVRFSRDVPYASAGFLLVRQSAFVEVGGFDPVFSPAYYEDVDLGLTLGAAGYRTVYEPRSVARHVREASTQVGTSGTLMKAHRPIVAKRWARTLSALPRLAGSALSSHPHRLIAARDGMSADRVLVVGVDGAETAAVRERAAASPLVRWTVLDETSPVASGDGVERVFDSGFEVVAPSDTTAWLEERRFHASVVVAGLDTPPEIIEVLARTQPQAVVVESIAELDEFAELAITSRS